METQNQSIPTMIEIYKNYLSKSKYDFNSRLINFLNYIKAKKGDNKSYLVKNNLIDMEKASSSEILVHLSQFKVGESLDIEKLSEDDRFTYIYDFVSFVNGSNLRTKFEAEKLEACLHRLKNLGSLIILVDIQTSFNMSNFIKNQLIKNPNTNYLIKSVISHKTPFLSFMSFQKFELKTPVVQENLKIHLAEHTSPETLEISKINDLTLAEFQRSYEYIYMIQEMSYILKKVSL